MELEKVCKKKKHVTVSFWGSGMTSESRALCVTDINRD